MSDRNTSYANQLDRVASKEAEHQRPANSNSTPSPSSAKSDFDVSKSESLQAKAQKASHEAKQSYGASPDRAPQPRGMGELGVNWQAHIKRTQTLRTQVEGVKRGADKPPAQLLDKAKRATREISAASPSFDKSASR